MQLINFSPANCRNCYKCVRSCPVKAIRFRDGQAEIDDTRCIACGQCFVVCPQNARNIRSDRPSVLEAISSGRRVVALIAPSFAGFYRNRGGFIHALKDLGFSEVMEVARGAEEVTAKYREHLEKEDPKYAISTCCPTVNLLIRRYYPEVCGSLLPAISPMMAMGKALKEADASSYTVFIGPCLSKKCEIAALGNEGIVDAVMTLEELHHIFEEKGIDPEQLSPMVPEVTARHTGRNYPLSGGIGAGLASVIHGQGYDSIHVEGVREVRELLEELSSGTLKKAYIELAACSESCIGGPCIPKETFSVFTRKQNVKEFVQSGWEREEGLMSFEGIDLASTYFPNPRMVNLFSEEAIEGTLSRMGKISRKDELNCGACGYDSCRQKAQAVLEGMSEVEMCMPFMRTKAEHMTDIIFFNSPNIILILDEELRIQQMNPSAEVTFGKKAEEVREFPVGFLVEDPSFEKVLGSRENALNKRVSYSAYGIVVMQSTIYLPKENQVLVIMSDITDEEKRRQELMEMKEKTLLITQKVIDKQMRVAQEIASLLGETTAETKVALNRLKSIVLKGGE
ncbi:MAG TPA: [Fe-Fe] hydrogenase large subunit C-terminal domain-containing protein [Clostridiaceae bacterium]|nr:[Fe-Fe] hydrogenase large subunit C-terminal domain-containing protein [Clostridiaceae bacterium]